jgi:ankyrin repeat protein
MGDWKVLELFEREARILEQLNHPAIPRYLDYFEVDTPEDRAFYIAQELAEGKSLADLVEIGWRTNEDGVRRIATQILEILVYLHSLKPPVVHRDIKPQNLICGKDGKIFLVDFGAVQDTYRTTLAKGSTIVGTYGYMAPEQFRGQAVPATDLYGLGATVLFLLTHRSPSDLPQERLKISFRSRIQVSEGFADWLEKMLEPDVEDRFPSAKEALAALQGRMVVAKTRSSVSWQALVGVGVAGVAAITLLNSFKWAVLGPLGFQPSGICEAAKSGNLDVVKNYLKQGGDLKAKDADTEELLLWCLLKVKNSKKDIAELVVAKLPDVNAKIRQYNDGTNWSYATTPLHLTASKEVAELLIAKGAKVNAKDNRGDTPLHYASIGDDESNRDVVKLLIAKGADVNAKDNEGNSPLHNASSTYYASNGDVVKLLIAKGADVNAKDNEGDTPLHYASGKRYSINRDGRDVVKLLIAKGADVNAKNNEGDTPLHNASSTEYGLGRDVAEVLIAKGADVNAKDSQGRTPLHTTYSKKVTQLLIAKGADIKAKDNQGRTPLHTAYSDEVAELLIAKGADVNAKDNEGDTPLHNASSTEYGLGRDVAEVLIAKGADIKAKDNQGRTPLHTTYSKEVAQLLIAKGADINAKDNQGRTPLHTTYSKEVAQLLIAKGADINAKDNDGAIALHFVRRKEVAELLIAKGVDVNAKDNQGRTPLRSAMERYNKQINDRNNEGEIRLQSWAVRDYLDLVKLLKSHGGAE